MILYDHTDAGSTYTHPKLLNGGNNSQVGVAKSYKVYPGDKVKIEAYAKFFNPTSTASNLPAFTSALLAAYGLPAPAAGEVATASAGLKSWGSIIAAGGDGESNASPHASVNIVLFDKNYNLLDAAFDQVDASAEQIGVSPVVPHDYLTMEYVVKEAGYVFMYIANENATQVDAYFDDVTMTYTPGNIVQFNEYYPFGLQTANSWTRDNNTGNNFLANGGTELNTTSNLYDLDYRNYDPVLGRMNGVDPMANLYSSLTPYNFSFNDPVAFTDPNGADPSCPTCGCMVCGNDNRSGSEKLFASPSQWAWKGDPAGGGYAWMGPQYDPVSGQHSMAERNSQGEWGYWFNRNYTGYDYSVDGDGSLVGKETVFVTSSFVDTKQEQVGHQEDPNKGWLDNELDRFTLLFNGDILDFMNYYPNAIHMGGIGGGTTTAIAGGARVFLSASSKNPGAVYTVYKAVTQNGTVYWGMTKDFLKRSAQHGDRFVKITEEYVNIGSKAAARGLEQMMIDGAKGIKNLENTINSIGVKNPRTAEYYQEAIRYLQTLNK